MLPAAHRLVDPGSFKGTVRRGRRAGSTTLVAHLLIDRGAHEAAQVGYVVSKAVGNAVVRNRVKRRLRHLTREHLPSLEEIPGRVVLVVRALPAAGTASNACLGEDLSRVVSRVLP